MSFRNRVVVLTAVVLAIGAILISKARNRAHHADSTPTASAVAVSTEVQSLPKILCLGAGKCIPCKAMEPVREALRAEYADRLDVAFCDVWQNRECGEKYGIRLIPTTIFYDASGQEVGRGEGFMSKDDILKRFAQLGISL